tara:strand:- start:93 stop:695 length:603 start_codon:yes stop_codon:yes gene_type:complete
MILSEDKKDIMKLGEGLTPNILKEINFNSSIKEVGHSFHGPFEAKLVDKFMAADPNFTEAEETRSIEDIKYKGNYINIKFGFDKKGNPNICSMHRLFDYFESGKIDSYYILSIDAKGPEYHLFNVFDYLDYTNFNYGTGQLMLKDLKFKEVYTFNDESRRLTKSETILKMADMFKEECDRHILLKTKQQKKIEEVASAYR